MPIDMLHYATEANRVRAIDSDYVRKLVTNAEITIKNKAFTKFPTATGTVDGDAKIELLETGTVHIEIIDGNHTLMAQKQIKDQFPNVTELERRYNYFLFVCLFVCL